MTDKEKLIKIKSLADKMYDAAFNLTTDASLLRKAMDDYHQFIINEYHKEEPVSYELEKAAGNYAFTMSWEDEVSKYYAFLAGAKWQKQKTIDKACEYLDLHCDEVKTEDNGIAGWIDNGFINNFKQAMKDE